MTMKTVFKTLCTTDFTRASGFELANTKKSRSWHLLLAQRAKRGFVKHYLRG